MNPVCVEHMKEMQMVETGKSVKLSDHNFIEGDVYECPECGNRIIATFSIKHAGSLPEYNYVMDYR